MWLVEAAGLRLLCDPTLERTHHGGVFEVLPPRRIDPQALRPDFILVSHRHTDHFDVPSLDRLAQLDPHSVIITPDELVRWACQQLGFETVHLVAPGQQVDLDGLRLVTTPSIAPVEWGVAMATDDGAVWNQVDAVVRDAEAAGVVAQQALAALGHDRFALTLARWNPLLEIAAQIGGATQFPYRSYARLIEEVAAVPTDAIVPSAAGAGHTEHHRFLDSIAYPISEARFLDDFRRRCPAATVWPCDLGAQFEIERGVARRTDAPPPDWIEVLDHQGDPRQFRPLHIAAMHDPNPRGHDPATMRSAVRAWLESTLCPALTAALGHHAPLRLTLDIVGPDRNQALSFFVGPDATRMQPGLEREWDGLTQISLSALYGVLEGELHWGDALLAGQLRGRTRAYRLGPSGMEQLPLAELFLYYGLSYADAEERQTKRAVRDALAARSADARICNNR